MTEVAQPGLVVAATVRSVAPMAFKRRLLKSYVRWLGRLMPAAAARRATDIFSYTRVYNQKPPQDVTPLGARRFVIEGAEGVRHGYLWGEGERTILLLHGWGTDSSSMYSFVRSLQKRNYRVAAFDAPAHGVSDGTIGTMTAYKKAIMAAITSLGGVDGIIAHSLGSLTSVAALSELPVTPGMREVKAICLMAPPCTLPDVMTRWSNGFLQLSERVRREMDVELARRNGVPVQYWDITQLGRKLTIPMLVLHDPQDTVVPFCDSEQIVKALPVATLIQTPKAGHVRILSDAKIVEQVAQFLYHNNESR